jgi:hypothetical protein
MSLPPEPRTVPDTWLTLNKFFEIRSHYVVQAGLDLLGSNDPFASSSQVAETTGTYQCAWLNIF